MQPCSDVDVVTCMSTEYKRNRWEPVAGAQPTLDFDALVRVAVGAHDRVAHQRACYGTAEVFERLLVLQVGDVRRHRRRSTKCSQPAVAVRLRPRVFFSLRRTVTRKYTRRLRSLSPASSVQVQGAERRRASPPTTTRCGGTIIVRVGGHEFHTSRARRLGRTDVGTSPSLATTQ